MLRGFFALLFVTGMVVLAAPFAVSSYYIDRYGIDVEGKVDRKSEYISIHNSGWMRTNTVSVEYVPPDSAGLAFFNTTLDPDTYDTYRKGQRVTVHYLQRKDLPRLPLADVLGRMRLLPVARLAGRTIFSSLDEFRTPRARRIVEWIVAAGILLIVWRLARWPRFPLAAGTCVGIAVIAILVSEFPRPTPAPATQVLHGSGRVVYVGEIVRIFSGRHSRGMNVDQPITVVGVEFVPAGRSEPVVAADMIDADSLPGLRRDAILPMDYEAASPRTAYLQGATREFPSRNLRGMVIAAVVMIAILAGFLVIAQWLDRFWKRLLLRRRF